MSTPDEVEVTAFFAKRLECELGNKFISENNEIENTDTDTYIIDSLGNKTSIQNVTSQGQILKEANINSRAQRDGRPFIAGQVNHLAWVSDALMRKEKKQYSNANKLVILIRASLPTYPSNQIQQMFSGIVGINAFAGVYYVSTPTDSNQSGYVVTLKKYWHTNDVF